MSNAERTPTLHQGVTAYRLWSKWWDDNNGDPGLIDTVMDDVVCMFCEGRGDYNSIDHNPDCIYLRVREMLGEGNE